MNVAPLEAHYWDLMELFIMKKVSLLCWSCPDMDTLVELQEEILFLD
jgi:hypothetical protein